MSGSAQLLRSPHIPQRGVLVEADCPPKLVEPRMVADDAAYL